MKLSSPFRVTLRLLLVVSMLGVSIAGGTTASAAGSGGKGPDEPKEVEAFVDEFFNRPEIASKLPGAAVVIVSGDKVLLNKGFGYANLETKQPVNPDETVFRVASISKVFAATAVLQLTEQGMVDPEGNVDQYVGGLSIPNQTGSPLKVKHLLTHTTGFDYTDNLLPNSTDLTKKTSLEEFIKDRVPTIVHTPGETYRYDNYASDLQGYLVQSVTRQPFEQAVKNQIFTPLQMNHSTFGMNNMDPKKMAVGYNSKNQPYKPYLDSPTISPSGGMLSTSSDISRFMLAQLNGGKLGASSILKPDTVADMQKVHIGISPELPNMAYGFEMFYQNFYNGQHVIGKSGDLNGYHSYMWLLPDKKTGGFVVTNGEAVDVRMELFQAFMDRYYPADDKPVTELHSPIKELAKFEGSYRYLRTPMLVVDVKLEKDYLRVTTPISSSKLKQIGKWTFQDEDGRLATFKEDSKGNIEHLYYLVPDSWLKKIAESEKYSDVPSGHAYADYIYNLRKFSVVTDSATRFEPQRPITRAEFSGKLIGLIGIKPSMQPVQFADVTGNPYRAQIQTLVEFGAVNGTREGKFEPDRPITREEAAQVICKLTQVFIHPTVAAKLSGRTDAWAEPAVRFVVGAGLYGPEAQMDQEGTVNYHSRAPMLRQEAAALLSKAAPFILAEMAKGKKL